MEDFIFKNNKTPRVYSFEHVDITFEMYGKKPKKIIGELKEKIYSELLKKNRLRENTLFYTANIVFRLKSYNYSRWELGKFLENEKFYIVVDLDRTRTEKLKKNKESNRKENI